MAYDTIIEDGIDILVVGAGLGGSGASSAQRHIAFLPGGQGLVYSVLGGDGNPRLVRQGLEEETGTPLQILRSKTKP